jgi:PAS domain S-box-containing protein
MDKRLKEISLRLSEYSLGIFDRRIAISPALDDIDAISNGINMLGEELKAVTISRDYFTNIFNSVSDMVFILNSSGNITDANKAAEKQLGYKPGRLKSISINNIATDPLSFFEILKTKLRISKMPVSAEAAFKSANQERIPVRYTASYFKINKHRRLLMLLTASDITLQKKTDNLILRAIIDTQEKERQRLAKDLHDSLTQQLHAIKLYISTTGTLIKNQNQKIMLQKSKEALTEVIVDMRNICFNLMPNTLREFGLINAIREFCKQSLYDKQIHFTIEANKKLPELTRELKIDIYRVVQEFITNSVKHGKASKISIKFKYNKHVMNIALHDNGIGFNQTKPGKGMGLQNAQSRVKSHNGKLNIESSIGKGTSYAITIPLNDEL